METDTGLSGARTLVHDSTSRGGTLHAGEFQGRISQHRTKIRLGAGVPDDNPLAFSMLSLTEMHTEYQTRHIIEDDSTGRTRLLEMPKHVSLSRWSPDTFEKGKARRAAICDRSDDEEMRDAVDNANLIAYKRVEIDCMNLADRARHLSHHKSGSASNFPSAACMVLELEPQYISTQSPLRTSLHSREVRGEPSTAGYFLRSPFCLPDRTHTRVPGFEPHIISAGLEDFDSGQAYIAGRVIHFHVVFLRASRRDASEGLTRPYAINA
ncbi:uncharacterized protein ARMOST_02359 [Armillaria ostoyae]|uniref:Uncharacterized protein n=1 Tax=Armillaria ostoyae TaxID=47428 RepID=A0A284QRF9_ARMOS|nr:uncharacterized protein ARMOST_02359 [Armillaria ostoyae]